MAEQWVKVNGYETEYEVSSLGRVRSIGRWVSYKDDRAQRYFESKIKSLTSHYKNKYLSVLLKTHQIEKRVFVHRLVAEHFIPNPFNKSEVNHKDGDKNNNRIDNLEWVTPKENTNHSIENGFTKHRHPVVAIQECSILEFVSKKECEKYFGVSEKTVRNAISNKVLIKGHSLYRL